jgi:hypothetical protein
VSKLGLNYLGVSNSAACMQMIYSPDGERLFTIGQDAHLRVHDVLQLYLPIRVLPVASAPLTKVTMALSEDGALLCTATKTPGQKFASILLFSGALRHVQHHVQHFRAICNGSRSDDNTTSLSSADVGSKLPIMLVSNHLGFLVLRLIQSCCLPGATTHRIWLVQYSHTSCSLTARTAVQK